MRRHLARRFISAWATKFAGMRPVHVRYGSVRRSRGQALRNDAEHWEVRGHLLELRKWRIFVHWDMRPGARRSLQVGLQYGGTLIRGKLFEANLAPLPRKAHRDENGHRALSVQCCASGGHVGERLQSFQLSVCTDDN